MGVPEATARHAAKGPFSPPGAEGLELEAAEELEDVEERAEEEALTGDVSQE